MRILICLGSIILAGAVAFAAAGSDAPDTKKPVPTKTTSKSAAAKTAPPKTATSKNNAPQPAPKTAAKTSATAPKTTTKATPTRASKTTTQSGRKQTASKQTSSRYRRSTQQQPTTERYKEIQQALADKGYFGGTVDGTWGPESVDALKRFQQEQNLPDDGKIGSLSLIALGLGPKHESATPPAEKSTP